MSPHTIELSAQGETHPSVTLSVDKAPLVPPEKSSKRILIIGGGVSGLMTAWILLDKGYRVTVLAKDWAWTKDWQHSRLTSQIAGALWEYPPGGCGLTEIANKVPGFAGVEHYREWALESLEFYTKLNNLLNGKLKKEFGVSITKLTQFFYHEITEKTKEEHEKLESIKKATKESRMTGLAVLDKGKTRSFLENLGAGSDWMTKLVYGYTHDAAIVNTDKAMVFLMALVENKGADFETREFDCKVTLVAKAKELKDEYGADAIVNATGLGAKKLAADDDVYPVRGAIKRIENDDAGDFRSLDQACLVPAQKGGDGQPTKVVFLVPRNDDTLIVGSIIQPHNDKLDLMESSPDVVVMWKRARSFLPALNDAGTVPWYPMAQGLRPFTKKNAKVRAEAAAIPIIHNYGHGGSGWTLAIGCARSAVYLLGLVTKDKDPLTPADANKKLYPETI